MEVGQSQTWILALSKRLITFLGPCTSVLPIFSWFLANFASCTFIFWLKTVYIWISVLRFDCFSAVKCGRLRKPSFGAIYPENCAQRKMPFGQRCAFACQPGFRLTGPSLRECILPGIWTGGTLSTRCLDTTPPQIHCPRDVIVKTDPELYYATLNMSLPKGLGKIFFLPCDLNKLYLLSRVLPNIMNDFTKKKLKIIPRKNYNF